MKLFNLFYFLFIFICFVNPQETSGEDKEELFAYCQKQYKIQELKSSEFSIENFLEYLELLEIPNKEIVVKQAILESGWFKSRLASKYNNLFGMMYHAKSRQTTATGIAYVYIYNHGDRIITYHPSRYNHWTDSVDDYLLFVKYWNNKGHDSTKDYYKFLDDIGYCYGGNYIKVLKSIDLSKYTKVPKLTESLS